MRKLPVDASPLQEMTIEQSGEIIRLTVRYNSVGDQWNMDVFDVLENRYITQAVPLVVGVPILGRDTTSYFFWLVDSSGIGLDPIGGNDMGVRCFLYIGDKSELS